MANTRDRVREHRRRLRAQGLRSVQIWVPDVRAPEVVIEAHRQSAAIAASEHESDDQAFVDAISVHDGSDPESEGWGGATSQRFEAATTAGPAGCDRPAPSLRRDRLGNGLPAHDQPCPGATDPDPGGGHCRDGDRSAMLDHVDKISTMPRIAVRDVLVVSRTPTRSDWTARSWSFSGWRNDSASLISMMHRPLTDCSGHRAASRFQ
jgi:hypothetical protein